jgi:hypothetical protein
MPANYAKRIVCLANSRKPGGRCVAGREVLANGYGRWIRPVSARSSAEISLEERRYEDGSEPQVLEVIEVPMIAPVPKLHQTENHMIDDGHYWSRKSALTWTDLPVLAETPATLWPNGISTFNGVNDCVPAASTVQLTRSLYLVRPENIIVRVQFEGGTFAPAKRRVRADFGYNGIAYRFMVTDPIAERAFLAREDGLFPLNNVYLCVSLTEPFDGDGRCHKLVAAVIGQPPW